MSPLEIAIAAANAHAASLRLESRMARPFRAHTFGRHRFELWMTLRLHRNGVVLFARLRVGPGLSRDHVARAWRLMRKELRDRALYDGLQWSPGEIVRLWPLGRRRADD